MNGEGGILYALNPKDCWDGRMQIIVLLLKLPTKVFILMARKLWPRQLWSILKALEYVVTMLFNAIPGDTFASVINNLLFLRLEIKGLTTVNTPLLSSKNCMHYFYFTFCVLTFANKISLLWRWPLCWLKNYLQNGTYQEIMSVT